MKLFRRNALRLALRNKGSFFGSMLIIGIGIFVLVSMFDTLRNLRDQIGAYYERQEMADVFAKVRGIPDADLARMEDLPGIAQADGKPAADARLLTDRSRGIVTLHLMGVREEDRLNLPVLRGQAGDDLIYIGTRMQSVYGFMPGEEIRVLLGGKIFRFTYGGSCTAPDYIYTIPPGGSMVPDGAAYDIAYISAEKMRRMTGTGARNELGFRLEAGYRFEDVRHLLAEYLEKYGLESLVSFEDQPSQSMVQGEFGELTATGTILPAIFMAISIFMLYVVLRKMIDKDQGLIGTMKALGMRDRELVAAYMAEGLAIGAGGALLGALTAGILGRYMFALYIDFFNLPDTVYHDYLDSRLTGLLLALISSLAAVWFGIRRILKITPAMAMRQRPPELGDGIRFPGVLLRHIGMMGRMALRSLSINPFRGSLIVLSVAFPFAMASVLLSFGTVVDEMLETEFSGIERYDIQAALEVPSSPERVRDSGEEIPGVVRAEGVAILPAEFCFEGHREYGAVDGLNHGSDLWRIADNGGRYYEPPSDGVLLNRKIADKLHISAGDTMEILMGSISPNRRCVRVTGIIDEPFGEGCYADLRAFPDVLGIPPAANCLLLSCGAGCTDRVISRLRDTGRVTWITDMARTGQSYRDMMESMTIMIDMFALLAAAAGGILIYNIAMINIRERKTELVTLRIMGVSSGEIGRMLLWENGILFALGIGLGFPGNLAIRRVLERVMLSDVYSITLKMYPKWCLAALAMCFCITAAAFRAECAFIHNMELTEALRERE